MSPAILELAIQLRPVLTVIPREEPIPVRTSGLCVCSAPLPSNRRRCDSCKKARKSNYDLRLRNERKAAGLCPWCASKAASGKVSCDPCIQKRIAWMKLKRQRLIPAI